MEGVEMPAVQTRRGPQGPDRPPPAKVEKYKTLVLELTSTRLNITRLLEETNNFQQLFLDLRDWRATAADLASDQHGSGWGLWGPTNLAKWSALQKLLVRYGQARLEAGTLWRLMSEAERFDLKPPAAFDIEKP